MAQRAAPLAALVASHPKKMSAQKHFGGFQSRVEAAMRRMMRDIASTAQEHFLQDNFRQQQFDGSPWQPRKPPRRKHLRRSDRRALLVKSGALRRSLAAPPAIDGTRITFRMVRYAKHHNEGDSPQPKRTFAGMDARLLEKIGEVVRRHLRRAE